MSALAPGHVLVLLRKVPETQVVVDLGKCRRFVVHPPYNCRRALDPGIPWRPIPKIFWLSPDGLWFEEGGHEFEIGKVFYVERHPVHITHHFLIMNKPLPSKLAPYRDQATGENYFKWLNQQAIKPDESCSDSIDTREKPTWNADKRTLSYRGTEYRRFLRTASRVIELFNAFESSSWTSAKLDERRNPADVRKKVNDALGTRNAGFTIERDRTNHDCLIWKEKLPRHGR
jgi:hypothetical protein